MSKRSKSYRSAAEKVDRDKLYTLEEALSLDAAADVYLVDEIGKMECFSAKFCAAMRSLLDSGRPLVATVGLRGGGFIAQVKARKDVEIWTVTLANRDDMPHQIVRWLEP